MKTQRSTPLAVEAIEPHMCSTDVRLRILHRVPFLAKLSEKDIAIVNQMFREHGYTPGETIYRVGERATRLYVVASGKVKMTRPTLTGQDILLEMLAPGEFFGSLSTLGDAEYVDSAQAQTACCVLGVGTDDFRVILQRFPAVAIAVLDIVAKRLQSAQETIRQLSASSVESRVASTLLKLAEKLGEETKSGTLIQAPLSRQELAEMTGTTTETVSRVLSHLRKTGVIRSGRRWVAVRDRARLAALADESVP